MTENVDHVTQMETADFCQLLPLFFRRRSTKKSQDQIGMEHNTDYARFFDEGLYSSNLSFWQTKRLKEFSAPRKVSSSKISIAAIQLGLLSRAI